MKSPIRTLPLACTLAAAAAFATLAACSRDLATNLNVAGQAPVSVRLASSASAPVPTGSIVGLLTGAFDHGAPSGFGDFGDGAGHHWRGWWGWARVHDVDSLIVTATKLEVLAAIPDSENAADSAADSARAHGGRGRGDDDHDDVEEREFGWTQLPVTGDGHLDLLHLPDSASAGLSVATGMLPAGRYRHVRLFVTNPLIYFASLIVTPAGDTLQPNVGYPVTFPSADSTGAALKTDDPFVVPAAGDTVKLYFDRDDTVRHIVITPDGRIIVPPVLR